MKLIIAALATPIIVSAGFYFYKSGSDDIAVKKEPIQQKESKESKTKPEQSQKSKIEQKTKRTIRALEIGDDNRYFQVYEKEIDRRLWQVVIQVVTPNQHSPEYRNILIGCESGNTIELSRWQGLMSEEPTAKIEKITPIGQNELYKKLSLLLCKNN